MATPANHDGIEGAEDGIRWFCTTAGATTPMEQVPINPLPDQVNPDGSDPEETDSDLDSETDAGDSEESEGEDEQQAGDGTYDPRSYNTRAHPRSRRSGYAIPNVDLVFAVSTKARLPAFPIGAVELLTFFPHHTQWPEAGLRLYRNGWVSPDIAKLQLHARGTLSKSNGDRRIAALRHQVLKNGAIFFNDETFAQASHAHLMTTVTSYDASGYAPRASIAHALITATLTDIARGVVNWPTGQDRGIVTQVIEHACQNGLNQLTTADIPNLALSLGLAAPSEASTTQWDQNARGRGRNIVDQAGTYV